MQGIHSAGRYRGSLRRRGDAANFWPLGSLLPPGPARTPVARRDAVSCVVSGGTLSARRQASDPGSPGDVMRLCLRAWQRRHASRPSRRLS